jgi:hypothetical protein
VVTTLAGVEVDLDHNPADQLPDEPVRSATVSR